MWFQDFIIHSELQLQNKPLPRQKPTAETFSDTPPPVKYMSKSNDNSISANV